MVQTVREDRAGCGYILNQVFTTPLINIILSTISYSKLAGAVGGFLAYGIGNLNGSLGLKGWQWLFLLEGIPSCIAGVIIYFGFPNFPETASWLTDAERDLAVSRLKGVGSQGYVLFTILNVTELYLHQAIEMPKSPKMKFWEH